jgi:hypothetical protein
MRKIVLLAAMLIAPGIAAPPAEAGERGRGHHFSAPPAFGHHRHVLPRHFGHRGGGVAFQYRSGGFGYRHGRPTFVRPPHVWRPPHRAPVLTFGRHPHAAPWRGFAPHHMAWRGFAPYQKTWQGRPQHRW